MISMLFMYGCSKEKSLGNGKSYGENIENKENSKGTLKVLSTDYSVLSDSMLEDLKKETGIEVEYEIVNWEQIPDALEVNKIETDVVQVDWSWIGQFKKNDLLYPIPQSDIDVEDIPSYKAFCYEDELYAVPFFNDFSVMFYNKEQYNKADIEDYPKTWDNIYENSKKISESQITIHPFHMSLTDTHDTALDFISLAYARNGIVFNENGTLNSDSALDTLNFIDNMLEENLIAPSSKYYYILDDYRKIATGETSSMIAPVSYIIGLNLGDRSNVVDKIKISQIPGKEDISKNTIAYPEGLAIMNKSKKKDLAKEYIDWYTSKETQKKLYEESNLLPTRISVLKDISESDELSNAEDIDVMAKNVEFPIPESTKKYYKEIELIISYCVNRMVIGEITKEESINLMDLAVQEVLNGNAIPEYINFTVD